MGEPADAQVVGQHRTHLLLSVAFAVLVLDVLSKVVVVATLSDREPLRLLGGMLYLTEARNTGAAFSLAEGATVVFTAIAMVVVAIIVRTAFRIRSTGWAIALALVLGGAAGNLVDRLLRSPGPFRGGVVDFLSVFDPYGRVWPIFNLADSAVVCGGALAVVMAVRGVDLDGTRSERGARSKP
ncbi:MAG: signal peptidase II [Geodermatophilaceae bacterium]|jgi:signal peptidase II|nr:signal peptidase II [Geodermatophilaceae bacterium]MDQ3465870.1 signal peptidase II [Actinomycetota bacterium]